MCLTCADNRTVTNYRCRNRRTIRPMPRVARGHVEQLPSGSFRAVVYAGVDPLTRRPVYLKATARTEKQAQVELGKLLGKSPLIKVQAG